MDSPASSGVEKTFTCAFCNKGFSNAQALGGHMNIHRRDRAKLMQSSDETRKISPETSGQSRVDDNILNDPKSSSPKRLSPLSREDLSMKVRIGDVEEDPSKQSSQLMVGESASTGEEPATTPSMSIEGDEHSESGIDLELRLGQEPRLTSK